MLDAKPKSEIETLEAPQAQNGAIIRNRAAATQPFDKRERRWCDRNARSRRRSPVFTNGATALQAASQASLRASRGVR
jgi:hypothetical protein